MNYIQLFVHILNLLYITSFFVQNEYLSNLALGWNWFYIIVGTYRILTLSRESFDKQMSSCGKYYKLFLQFNDFLVIVLGLVFGNYLLALVMLGYALKFYGVIPENQSKSYIYINQPNTNKLLNQKLKLPEFYSLSTTKSSNRLKEIELKPGTAIDYHKTFTSIMEATDYINNQTNILQTQIKRENNV